MAQHILEPTPGRTGQDPRILDLVIINDPNIISEITYEVPLGKKDHACLKFHIKSFRTEQGQQQKLYAYDKRDYVNMN